MKAIFVCETLNFERGKDPYDALNIGKKEIRLLTRLEVIAKKFGFERIPIEELEALDGPDPNPKSFKDIALWVHPKHKHLVLFYERKNKAYDNPNKFSIFTLYYAVFGRKNEDDKSAEWFLDEKNWITMFGSEINEGNF